MFTVKMLMKVIILVINFSQIFASGCEIYPFSDKAPLVINPRSNSIIYPRYRQGTLKLEVGEIIEFACPQTQIQVGNKYFQSIVTAECTNISWRSFRIQGRIYQWEQIMCRTNPISTAIKTNFKCGTDAWFIGVGFDLGFNRFLRTMTICFDILKQIPLYSSHDLTASIGSRDCTIPTTDFVQDSSFYKLQMKTVNKLYKKTKQRATINNLLDLPSSSQTYIGDEKNNFFFAAHLSANSNFVYGAQQNLTFRYINTAPQWKMINDYNWNKIEQETREYADRKNVNLKIWTGTYGVATLHHSVTDQDTKLYLFVSKRYRALPVPALFWKLIYNPINRQGVVLILINNPYVNDLSKNIICSDISDQISWLTWDKHNILKGYSYACTLSDFRRTVSYAPYLYISDLLL